LVHVGFPLNASSASHIKCLQKSFTTTNTKNTKNTTNTTTSSNNNSELKLKLKSKSKSKSKSLSSIDCMGKYKNRWDSRDFSVPQDKLLHLLQQFVVDVDVDVNKNTINGSNGSDGSSIAHTHTRTRASSSSSSSSSSSNLLTCKDYQNLARDDYVVYNVMCSDNDNNPSNKTIHHFYRNKEWGDTKTNCAICTYYN
jgi:hypothetical protein